MNRLFNLTTLSFLFSTASFSANLENPAANLVQDENSVVFTQTIPRTIHITPGITDIQSGEFTIPAGKTGYVSSFIFSLTNTPQVFKRFRFFLNGGEVAATITSSQNQVIIAVKRPSRRPLTGVNSFSFQANAQDVEDFQFQPAVTGAQIVDRDRLAFGNGPENLPLPGNIQIMNGRPAAE